MQPHLSVLSPFIFVGHVHPLGLFFMENMIMSNVANLAEAVVSNKINKAPQLQQKLYQSAQKVGLSECSGDGVTLETTPLSIQPIANLTGAVEKVLSQLHLVPEILESKFWNTIYEPARQAQWQLCKDFIDQAQPIAGRVRVDTVVSEYNDDRQIACAIEFEPHAGDDVLIHTLNKVYDDAGQPNVQYLDELAAAHIAQSPKQKGKLRVIQWSKEERTDIDYAPIVEKLLKEYRKRGIDAQQFLYNDPNADWDDALVYRIFEFSEIHKSPEQQKLVDGHNKGQFRFANPAFVFGKLISLFATEFDGIFRDRLGMTELEMKAFPVTVTAKDYLTNEVLQKRFNYKKLFLKGILSEGSGGGNDVFPLKNCSSLQEALDFIKDKSEDGLGGWILQHEAQRERFTFKQKCEETGEVSVNENAGVLQRQIFVNGKFIAHYNLSSSKNAKDSDKMHAEAGVAAFI